MTTSSDSTRRRTLQIAAGLAAIPIAQAVAAAPDVVGVWRLVAGSATAADGKKLPVPYGPRGMGIVTLTSDGRMMAVLCDGRPSLPAGAKRLRQKADGMRATIVNGGIVLRDNEPTGNLPGALLRKRPRH